MITFGFDNQQQQQQQQQQQKNFCIDPKQIFLSEKQFPDFPCSSNEFFEIKIDESDLRSFSSETSPMDSVYSENEDSLDYENPFSFPIHHPQPQHVQVQVNTQLYQQPPQPIHYPIPVSFSSPAAIVPSVSNYSTPITSPIVSASSTLATSTTTTTTKTIKSEILYEDVKQETPSREGTPDDDDDDDMDDEEDYDESNPLDKVFKQLLPLSTKKFNEKISEWKLKKEEIDYLKKKRRRVKNAKAARTRRSKISSALKELQEKVNVLESQLKDRDRIIKDLQGKLKKK